MGRKRKHGEGTVRLRKDGRWEGRIVVGLTDDGKTKRKSFFAKTKAEVIAKMKAAQEELGVIPERVCASMHFGAWMDFWYKHYKKPTIKFSTQYSYEGYIYGHIIPGLGHIRLNKLKQSDFQGFYQYLKKDGRKQFVDKHGKGLSDACVRAMHFLCQAALDRAIQEKLIISNPASGSSLPPKRGREMQVLTSDEIQRLLIQAKYEGFLELFLLELSTGMRRGELMALEWKDLDFETGELRIYKQLTTDNRTGRLVITTPKTKCSNRVVVLPPSLLALLKRAKDESDSRWMFPSPLKQDCPRSPSNAADVLNRILERADCKHIRFHDLRHTFATTALEHGMDIKTLSTIIGHVSSATTLDIYAHITTDMQRTAASTIDRGLGKSKSRKRSAPSPEPEQPKAPFVPKEPAIRRPGTGCISQKGEYLFEGRYSPVINGKRHGFNVYAKTREECEILLAELIEQKKAEIAKIHAKSKKKKTDESPIEML